MLYFTFISCLLFRGTLSYKLTKNRKLCLEFDCFIIVKISELHFRFGAFDFSHICFSVCMCVILNRFVDLYMCTGVSVYVRGLVFIKIFFTPFPSLWYVVSLRRKGEILNMLYLDLWFAVLCPPEACPISCECLVGSECVGVKVHSIASAAFRCMRVWVYL